jgi:hypothetical protein
VCPCQQAEAQECHSCKATRVTRVAFNRMQTGQLLCVYMCHPWLLRLFRWRFRVLVFCLALY